MFDLPPDLDGYRSVEELQRLANDVQAELTAMERESDGRPYKGDERDKFAGLAKLKKEIPARINELRAREQVLRANAAQPGRIESLEDAYYPPARAGVERRVDEPRHLTESREAGLRAIEGQAGVLTARAGDRLEALVRSNDPDGAGGRYLAAVSNPAYLSAFGKLVCDPTTGHLRFSPAEVEAVRLVGQAEAQRNLNVTTGSAGQFAIPFVLDPSIILTGTGVLNPIRELSSVDTIAGATTWKGVSSDGVVAAFGAEGAVATDASPTLSQPTITTQKAFCFVPFTIEVGEDWGTLQTELVRLMNDAKNVLEATKFLLGTGTNEPTGILNIGTGGLSTSQRVQTATSATYAVGDPWLLKAQIPPRFISASSYLAGPAIWDKTYRFVAQGSTTEPRQFADGDRGGDFLGAPKAEVSTMVVTTTTGSKIMVAGDLRTGFKIIDRVGGSVELIPHLFGAAQGNLPVGMRGLYYYWRVGSAVVAQNALRYLEVL